MSQALIREAFETALQAWADGHSFLVAWENAAFDPAETYVRANLLPAQTLSYDLLGKHRRFQGLFQITLVMPPNEGMQPTEALIAELEALFPYATRLTAGGVSILIARPLTAAPPIFDDGRISVPVTVRYAADVTV